MCKDCGWNDYLEIIREKREDSRYRWAIGTLGGIAEHVRKNRHIGPRQITAIRNISRAANK